MSKRNRREHGRILSVETMQRGSALDADAAAGATSITVVDGGDFDEDGGWLYIGAQVVQFTACDDDTGVITFKAGATLTVAAEQGDPVAVYDPLYAEAVDYQVALVQLDGEYDNPDPVEAEVAEGVEDLPEGDRGKAGESCTLHRVTDDEWEIVGVGGRSRKSRGIRFEADDTYVLTAGDITAATATVPLTYRPVPEGLTAVLAGVPQRPSNFTVNYDAQTITWPLSGWEKAGDRIWVHYAYRKGISTATARSTPTLVGVTKFEADVTSVTLPAGTQEGDLLILAASFWNSGSAVSDARMTLHDTFPGENVLMGRAWVGTATASTAPIAVNITGTAGAGGCSGVLMAIRGGALVDSAVFTKTTPVGASYNAPTVTDAKFAAVFALDRLGNFSTGSITHPAGGYTIDSTAAGTKANTVAGHWTASGAAATSPADAFNVSGTADGFAIAVYKIEGTVTP